MLAYLNHIPSYPHLCIFNSAITNYPPFLVTHFHTPLLLSILFPLYRMAFPLIVYVVNFRKSFKTQFYEVFLPFIQNYLYFLYIFISCLHACLFCTYLFYISVIAIGEKLYMVHFGLRHNSSLSLMQLLKLNK